MAERSVVLVTDPPCLVVATISGEVRFPSAEVFECGTCGLRSDHVGPTDGICTAQKGRK